LSRNRVSLTPMDYNGNAKILQQKALYHTTMPNYYCVCVCVYVCMCVCLWCVVFYCIVLRCAVVL